MNPKLLIDADFFFYRAASACEMEQEYNPDLTVIVGDFRRGKQIVEQELNKLRTRFDTDDIVLFFTDKELPQRTLTPTTKATAQSASPAVISN